MTERSRILIVEDSKFFSNLVTKAIAERIDAQVVTAVTFAETQKVVTEAPQPFDLALVDIVLPDAPEGQVVDWLLERGVPSIVFTSIFSEDLRERLLSQHVIDYVVKNTPSSLDYLVGLVERLHRNRTVKVMVVDDSKVARMLMVDLLRSYQFEVIEAGNGRQGLDMLAAHPDLKLVITDYHMPEMDGVEMTRAMRAAHDQDRLAIIGVSSGGGNALSAKFIKFGANDFINKPFLPEEFFCRVMQNVRMLDMLARLTDMATRDPLTGIHNRRFLFDAGGTLFASAQREHLNLTAAVIDLDFFKTINDSHGHGCGDDVLRHVAGLIRKLCRPTDIVARFGGEEFAILAVNMDGGAVAAFFEKIRTAIEAEEIDHERKHIKITASIGVCHGIDSNLETMLKTADEQLYRAKQNGRNRVEIA